MRYIYIYIYIYIYRTVEAWGKNRKEGEEEAKELALNSKGTKSSLKNEKIKIKISVKVVRLLQPGNII